MLAIVNQNARRDLLNHGFETIGGGRRNAVPVNEAIEQMRMKIQGAQLKQPGAGASRGGQQRIGGALIGERDREAAGLS